MICHLCKNDVELKNSHIIPEFIYKPLYDEKHRFHVFSTLKATKTAKEQKGLRELLLCGICEVKLSKFERYVSLIFTGSSSTTSASDGDIITISGLNYKDFKLFTLSVLWRASISSLPFFKEVNLGPHEEIIRKMIHNEDPGNINLYPFILSPALHDNEIQTDLIIQPTKLKFHSHNSYRFVFAGIVWLIIVSRHKLPKLLLSMTLSKSGILTMLKKEISSMPFINDFVTDLKDAGKIGNS